MNKTQKTSCTVGLQYNHHFGTTFPGLLLANREGENAKLSDDFFFSCIKVEEGIRRSEDKAKPEGVQLLKVFNSILYLPLQILSKLCCY